MNLEPFPNLFTPQDYLDFERRAEARHEFIDDVVSEMPGADIGHSLIKNELIYTIHKHFDDRNGHVFATSLRLCVDPQTCYLYPDIVALCEEPRTLDAFDDNLLNPALILEIMSPRSEIYDRGEKFALYRLVPSLRVYVLVAQDRKHVERFTRDEDRWTSTVWNRPDDLVRFESIGFSIPLATIYRTADRHARNCVTPTPSSDASG